MSMSGVERLAFAMDAAEPVFGASLAYSADQQLGTLRLKGLAKRLQLLGYLPTSPAPEHVSRFALGKALQDFQVEARLPLETWALDEAWGALDALINFDSDVLSVQRFATTRAFARALRARLYAYGFIGEPQPGSRAPTVHDLRKSICQLRQAASVLGLPSDGSDREVALLLFDRPKMLRRLAERAVPDFLFPSYPGAGTDTDTILSVRAFIGKVVDVELWIRGSAGRSRIKEAAEYWARVSTPGAPFPGLKPPLFEAFANDLAGDGLSVETLDAFEALLRRDIDDDSQTTFERLAGAAADAAAFIWDGFKTGSRFLGRIFNAVVDKARALRDAVADSTSPVFWALSRFLTSKASKVFDSIASGTAAIVRATRFLSGKPIGIRDATNYVCMRIDLDGDCTAVTSSGASPALVGRVLAPVNFLRKLLAAGLFIIATASRAATTIATGAWPLLILTLIKALPELVDRLSEIDIAMKGLRQFNDDGGLDWAIA